MSLKASPAPQLNRMEWQSCPIEGGRGAHRLDGTLDDRVGAEGAVDAGGETWARGRDPARADAILKEASRVIGSAQQISVNTKEEIERVRRNGEKQTMRLAREVKMQRSGRMWSKVTGARELEVFFDGGAVTLLSHGSQGVPTVSIAADPRRGR
jgi:hypothetical protein